MSKGLEALNRIKMLEISCERESYDLRPITKTHKEDLNTIEKELKALEIIRFRNIDIIAIKTSHNLEEYKLLKNIPCEIPNDKEYELLREVLL